MSQGGKFRDALAQEKPLQVIGAICAYHARLAQRAAYDAKQLAPAQTPNPSNDAQSDVQRVLPRERRPGGVRNAGFTFSRTPCARTGAAVSTPL